MHQFEPLVLDEVGEILEVESGQRQLAREAAGGDPGPPGQLTHGDERDCEGSASELTVEGGGYSLAQDRRCDVGIEDDEAHATSDLREA